MAVSKKPAAQVEEKEEKRLKLETSEFGTYSVYYTNGGPVPECLRGMFTSVSKLRELVRTHYGKDMLD